MNFEVLKNGIKRRNSQFPDWKIEPFILEKLEDRGITGYFSDSVRNMQMPITTTLPEALNMQILRDWISAILWLQGFVLKDINLRLGYERVEGCLTIEYVSAVQAF